MDTDAGLAYAVSVLAGLLAQARAENEALRAHVGIPPGMPAGLFLQSQSSTPPAGEAPQTDGEPRE